MEAALRGGADVVQLRDKSASDEELLAAARRLLVVTRRHGKDLIVNDRLEVARLSGADGIHLGQEDGDLDPVRRILGSDKIYGRSTHSVEQILRACAEGFDYIGVGPVHATPTKAGRAPVGLELVRQSARIATVPFVAIGGIDETNVRDVRREGASCVAVVRALCGKEDPRSAAEFYRAVMEEPVDGK